MALYFNRIASPIKPRINIGDKLSSNDVIKCGYGTTCPHCGARMSKYKSPDLYDYDCTMSIVYSNDMYEITGLCNTLMGIKKEEECISECSCDLFSVLLVTGCRCGKMEQERKTKGKN